MGKILSYNDLSDRRERTKKKSSLDDSDEEEEEEERRRLMDEIERKVKKMFTPRNITSYNFREKRKRKRKPKEGDLKQRLWRKRRG